MRRSLDMAVRLTFVAATLFGLNGCGGGGGGSNSPSVPAVGTLSQAVRGGPIVHVTRTGWRTEIHNGAVTVKPPVSADGEGFQYVSRGTREALGPQDLRSWAGDRRSLLLPGGAKLTLHAQGDQLKTVSVYDGDESHQIDALAQVIVHSQIDPNIATSRDVSEHDGETAYLRKMGAQWIYLLNIYAQGAAADGSPLDKAVSVSPLARQFTDGVYVYPALQALSPPVTDACDPVAQPRGGLTQVSPGGILTYITRSGEWQVVVDKHTITVSRRIVGTLKWEVWGDPHENLNGKHIKDWESRYRSLLLEDGTKVTMWADGPQKVVEKTSIYDGPQSHEIRNVDYEVRHSCVNTAVAQQRDAQEADGEVAHLTVQRSPASTIGSLFVANIYTENPDAVGEFLWEFVPLGETGEVDINPRMTNDYYDDPRLNNT